MMEDLQEDDVFVILLMIMVIMIRTEMKITIKKQKARVTTVNQ
jgi:hypothetical protein